MPRSPLAHLALASLAAAVLFGCGGGGKKGSGGTPTIPQGAVLSQSGIPLTGATVTFYTDAGVAITTATVGSNGLIGGTVPANATRFTVDPSTITATPGVTYYEIFSYDGLHYSASSGCLAPLPKTGSKSLSADVVLTPSNDPNYPPTPPVDGCAG